MYHDRSTRSHALALVFGLGLMAVLALIAGIGYVTAEVVEEGRLLPYTPATAERLLIFGTLEATVQNEPPNTLDTAAACILAGIATIGIIALLALPGLGVRRFWFYVLLALGSLALAADEVVGLHETIGANARFLQDLPGVNSPEDVVFGLYLLPALAFLGAFRELLASSRLSTTCIGAGLALFCAAAVLDIIDALMDEQLVEIASLAFLFAGFASIAIRDLGDARPAHPSTPAPGAKPVTERGRTEHGGHAVARL